MKEKPEQDKDLFQQSLEGVTPLKPSGRIITTPAPRKISPRSVTAAPIIADNLSDHGASDEPLGEYLSNGLSRMTLRKLRRGEWPPQDSLDLHGLNVSDQLRTSGI